MTCVYEVAERVVGGMDGNRMYFFKTNLCQNSRRIKGGAKNKEKPVCIKAFVHSDCKYVLSACDI